MKWNFVLAGIACYDLASAIAIPDNTDLFQPAQRAQRAQDFSAPWSDLFKRKGGGASGGKGGSSSSGSSSSGSSGSSSSSSGSGSSTSSSGGRTGAGSGVAASYGGGRYYGGGTTVPYRAGGVSTLGIAAIGLFGVGALSLAFWPGTWYHPAYIYPYNNPWYYHNATTNETESKPVKCACDAYQVCGCDDNNSTEYVNSVLGDGSYNNLNQSLVTVANVNGTDTILVNGTLPNGTTASGGAGSMRELLDVVGWWPAALTVVIMAL